MVRILEQYLEDAHMEKRAYIQQVLELQAEVRELGLEVEELRRSLQISIRNNIELKRRHNLGGF